MARTAPRKQTSRSSRSLHEGECWAIALPKLGYCPVVVARAPAADADPSFAYVYIKVELSHDLPAPETIGPVESWVSAWVGLISSKPLREQRWTRLGMLPGFDRDEWPIAPARASCVDEQEPVEKWGEHPWGEMWCIQTTLDEPGMTVISNVPASREEALRFPAGDVISWASSLEKALIKHFKKLRPGFFDLKLSFEPVLHGAIRHWRDHARRVRAAWSPDSVRWLPPGRKTDRGLTAGTWMGLPLIGGGFGAAMLVAKPEKHERFWSDAVVMTMRRRWDRWPNLDDVIDLRPEDGAQIAQTSMICVRDGRWRVLGMHPRFDPDQWVWPKLWTCVDERCDPSKIRVSLSRGKSIELTVPADVLRLDPWAGRRCAGMSSYSGMELDTPRIIDGTCPVRKGDSLSPDGIVTPERLNAWRQINAAIRQALESRGTRTAH